MTVCVSPPRIRPDPSKFEMLNEEALHVLCEHTQAILAQEESCYEVDAR